MVNLPTKFEVSTFSLYGDMKCVKMHKMGWFGVVRGHPRSSAMSPFDRAHMISYSSLTQTMRLSCTVFEIRRVICRNSPTLPYPTCSWRPHWVTYTRSNFEKIFGVRKLESLRRCCVYHPTFNRLSRTPTCDRQTDRQTHTDRHRAMTYTAPA